MKEDPFQSGAIRLPPREFLKRLPVRVSHLVFEIASEDNNLPWKALKEKLSDLSGPCKLPDQRNKPIYFIEMEHGQGFQCFKSNKYLNKEHELSSGAIWVVRFEQHTHFVSFSFHRYFESSCTSIADGGALDFLNLEILNYEDGDIDQLLESTVPGGNIDLAIVPGSFNKDELAMQLKLDVKSPYVTRSNVFGGMAEVSMSFQIDEDQTEKPRPVMIRGLDGMSERAAGEVIQILLEIEAYRAMAFRRIPQKHLHYMLNSLGSREQYFVEVSEVCKEMICKKPKLIGFIIDLFKVEDYLPIMTELAIIALKIDHDTAEHVRHYDTAQAYCNLALDRLGDLREKRIDIDQEPTIKTFLHHRLKQTEQTYKAIGQRQDCLSLQISRLDGLLRSRMEARQNFSVHCVHFMILGLTVFAVLHYLPEVINAWMSKEVSFFSLSPTSFSLWFLLVMAVVLLLYKMWKRGCINKKLVKAKAAAKLAEWVK